MVKYSDDIEQVHNDFKSACEEMLAEAEKILKKAESDDHKKGLRLNSLGFKQAKQVSQSIALEETLIHATKERELIMNYAIKYPHYKFIKEDKVKKICEKYGLVKAPIDRYKGFVPEKCVQDMEKFKKIVKKEDLPENFIRITKYRHEIVDKPGIDLLNKLYPDGWIPAYLSTDDRSLIRHDKIENHKYEFVSVEECEERINDSWEICAPEKDIDTNSLKKNGFSFFKTYIKKIEIKDPVVLQPVKGGYIIITAWGDEASDPLVLNETMN